MPGIGKQVIGYKYVKSYSGMKVMLKILVPKNVKRLKATNDTKCRAARVIIQDACTFYGERKRGTLHSPFYGSGLGYRVGEHLKADKYSPDKTEACMPGIHFFLNIQDAVKFAGY